MRILWLSHFVPYPPKGGCFQRSYNLIARVGAAHELHLVAMLPKRGTHPEAETARAKEELSKSCRSVQIVDVSGATSALGLARRAAAGVLSLSPLNVTIFQSEEVRRLVRSMIAAQPFDVIHLDTISLAQYQADAGDTPAVMTHHGAESFMIHRRIRHEPNPISKAVFLAEWLALERYERRMMPRVESNVVMSELDREILAAVAPDARFAVVPNGVDIDFFTPAPVRSTRRVIFAGRLDQYSNRDAILHFMQEAWPRLQATHPDARIDIIGSNPPPALGEMAARDPQIAVHGFVPDVRPYFREAAVAICPIRDGGGTRIKVLDALAQGMPLVSTSIGAEGIDVVPDRDVLIADTPEQFAASIGRLFDDGALAARLATSGRALVERQYSWDALAEALVETYRQAAGARTRARAS
jgi:glycosyltransferase involved in cell wall biosynthesis